MAKADQKNRNISRFGRFVTSMCFLCLGSPLLAGPPMHISIPMVSKPLVMVWNAFAILRLGNFNTFCVFPPDSKAPNSHFSFQCVDLWRPAFSSHPRGSAWFSATILIGLDV